MSGNEMVPQNGSEGVYSGIANSEGTVNIPEEFLGGMSFIQFKLDKDRNLLVNSVSGEESPELLVRVCGVKMERAFFEEGELVCASRDGKYSKDGVQCDTCPNVSNKPFMDEEEQRARYNASCKKSNIENPPEWNAKTKCNFRLVVQWVEQFEKNDEGQYMWIAQPGLCYLSCPISSVAAMTFRQTGYLSRLKSKGYGDLKNVVTKISVGQRRNEKLKTNYSYEIFDLEGAYDAITQKSVNYKEMVKAMGGVPQITAAQPPAPQVAQAVEDEAVQPELPQVAQPKVATAMPKEFVKHKTAQASKIVEAEEVPQTAQPVVASQPSSTEMRLKIKFAYASLPADVQQIILNVLKIESIDKVVDGDLKVAMETLELAKKEVAERPAEPTAPSVAKTETAAKPVSTNKTPW